MHYRYTCIMRVSLVETVEEQDDDNNQCNDKKTTTTKHKEV